MLSQATASLEYHWFECMSTTFLFFFHFYFLLSNSLRLSVLNTRLFFIAFGSFCLASYLLHPTHVLSLLLFVAFASPPACYVQLTPFLYCFLDLLPRLLLVTSNSFLFSIAFWTFCLASCLLHPIHSYYPMLFGPFVLPPACYVQFTPII